MSKLSEKNKMFWALDKRSKRIAIAKDVIKMLDVEKIIAHSGTYFNINQSPTKDGKLDAFINKKDVQCTVCALGAVFAGLVDMGDKITVEESIPYQFHGKMYTPRGRNIDNDFIRKNLREVFSSPQIALIESAFEQISMADGENFPRELRELRAKAIKFGKRYKDDSMRLIAIMKNIITNRGTFRPDKP